MEDLIKSLGEPINGNEYILKPINGEWWIEHKYVGSGEPLIQWLKTELRQPIVSGSFLSRDDAYKEGLGRMRTHGKNIVWKAKIFAAGAMWAKMKLTGISDVIGNYR